MKYVSMMLGSFLCLLLPVVGRAQFPSTNLAVAVTAYSSSTGATVVAWISFGGPVILEASSGIPGLWSVLGTHNLGTNTTWQFQDTGATSVGQRYYRLRTESGTLSSVNVAGLIKMNAASGLTLLANPLRAASNIVGEAFRTPADGFSIFRLTSAGFEANNYLSGWTTPSMPFQLGEGYFLRNPSANPSTVTFFGELPQGTLINSVPAGSSLLSSIVPQSGLLQSDLGFPTDEDVVLRWNSSFAEFSVFEHIPGPGWFPTEPSLNVGEAFWLITSTSRNWTRSFSLNFAPLLDDPSANLDGGGALPGFVPAGGSPVQVNFFTYNFTIGFGRVFDSDGTTPLGTDYVGQLFAGAANSEGSLSAVGTAVTFPSGPAAGYINSGLVSVAGISAGQPIYLQLRVWESARGATYAAAVANGSKNGKSAIFSVTAVAPPDNGPTVPPPSANGFVSFSLAASLAPPLITAQPQSRTNEVGDTAVFDVTASGSPPLSLQWRKNGVNIPGATSQTLELPLIQAGDNGSSYTVLVSNAVDTITSSSAILTVVPAQQPSGVLREVYLGVTGAVIADLTNHATFPNNPSFEDIQPTFEAPANFDESYGQRMRALLVPPATGNYTFWIASDDGGALYLSTDETPANKAAIASVGSWTSFRDWTQETNQQSAPIALTAGQLYYIEALHKEGGGGDHLTIRWRLPDDSIEEPIPGTRLRAFGPGAPSITGQPDSVTSFVGGSASFSVEAIGAPPLSYQWYFNSSTLLTSMTNATLSLTNLQSSTAGSYHVVISNSFGSVSSIVAILTVNPADDRDGDGMPNGWEQLYGFNPDSAADALTDLDGDGMTNVDEYRADTDPTNASSYLAANIVDIGFGDLAISFATRTGLSYGVEYSVSLDDPLWTELENLVGTGSSAMAFDPGANFSPRRFYRLSAHRSFDTPRSYSVNIVGFANIGVAPGSNYLAAPFVSFPSTADALIPNPPDGSCIVKSDGQFACYEFGIWEPFGVSLSRGEPFEFHNPLATDITLTFVGEVAGKPVIVQQPTNFIAEVGASVNMHVASVGALPLRHQWYFNQTNPIAGATNATLVLTNLEDANVGGYSVVVTNLSGSATSTVATLTVLLPLGPTPHISSISMPVNGCNSPCRPVYDQIWSVTSPPYPLNTSSGIGIIVNPQFVAANVNTDFALHENGNYASSHVPQPSRAVVTYQFDQPAVVDQLEIIQHFNGITRVEGFVGDNLGSMTSIGSVFGPAGDIVNTAVGADGDSHVFHFSNSVPARYFRFVVRKTAHSSAFAIHRAIPSDPSGNRYRRVPGLAEPPLVTSNPTSRTIYTGADVSFTAAMDGTPPFEFQWQFNGTDLPGMTNSTFQLANVQLGNAGTYRLIVTSPYGSATSGSATLTVLPCLAPPSGMVAWWPGDGNADDFSGSNRGTPSTGVAFSPGKVGQGFSFDGTGAYIDAGNSTALRFSGTTPFSVQGWVNPEAHGTIISKFNGQIEGEWSLSVDDTHRLVFARESPPFQLAGNEALPLGQFSHVTATYDGTWMRLFVNGVLDGQTDQIGVSGNADNTAVLIGAHFELGVPTNYFKGQIDELSVFNRALDASEITAIHLAGSAGLCKPVIQVQVDGRLVTTNVSTVTNFTMLSFQTSYPGGSIFYTLTGSHPGAGTLYTGPVLVNASVVVRAIAYNADYTESAESEALTLTVVRSPSIAQQPVTQTVLVGQPVVFTAQAVGDAPLFYQWFFNGTALAGASGSSFVRDGALLSHAGAYWVVASNPYGSATSVVAGLTVLLRPSIASQPASTNVNTGENATFCVSAIGSAPLVFQWRKNGVNIPGATNSCYAIANVQATNAGAYSVVVGNGADAVTSAEAELVLADLPNGPPPEDFFANRNGLFGNPGALEVNNIGATKEAGEPDHAGKPGGASVWYAWTPEESGIATLRTSGSAFDTLLAVYRGTDVAALTPVVANEDGGGFLTSEVRFNATNGVEYQIAVDGFAGAQGSFVLSWDLEATTQVLPVITSQPQSLTVLAGSDAPFSVSAGGNGLTYQWYFNGARINGATNFSFTRTNVQSADVGYYAVAVTNSQFRGLLSEAAVLEIGPFPDVRSTDKVEDLLGGPQPAPPGARGPFQATSSGFASVTIGSLGTQVLNTTNSTTSFRETNHCGVIGGSSRWFKLKAAANGLMSIDTFGSTFDTVLAAYTGDPLLGGYPTKLIECNNDGTPDARWSRVLYSATNAIEYLIAVDGANSAAGTVQLNWSLGLPPVIISNPPPLSPLVGEGETLQLTTVLTNGLPPPQLQWYLNGEPILDATNATYAVGAAQRQSGGTYTVVAYNSLGSLTSIVANVTVEVPLELNLQPVQENGKIHFRVSGTASQTFILQGSTNFVNWQPLYTNTAAGAPVSFDDRSTTNRARRYYRALPWP